MSVTRQASLIRQVRKHIAGGFEKRDTVPPPQTRFEKLGTIFSRTTGLIKSGVYTENDVPIWYSVYKAFPPKYEPRYKRPPLDIDIQVIYYPEDKLRQAMKRWEPFDLASDTPNKSQELVATFRKRRTTSSNDQKLVKDLLEQTSREVYKEDKSTEDLVAKALEIK